VQHNGTNRHVSLIVPTILKVL